MPRKAVCPECEATVRLPDDFPPGKRIRCPKCKSAFAPATSEAPPHRARPRDEDDDDRPRPAKSKKKRASQGSLGLWIGLGVGGLLVVVAVVVVLVLILGGRGPGVPNVPVNPVGGIVPALGRSYTIADLNKLTDGMTPAEVENALGVGRTISAAEAQSAYQEVTPNTPQQTWTTLSKGVTAWTAWGNKGGGIYAGFSRTKKGDTRLTFAFYTLKQGLHAEFVQGAMGGVGTIDRKDQDNAKMAAFEKDPQWATGPKVRELVVGKWKRDASELELMPGGGIRTVFPKLMAMRNPKTYRFRDDITLEIDAPDVFKREITKTQAFRVFVSADELHLMQINNLPNLPVLWDGPYRRK